MAGSIVVASLGASSAHAGGFSCDEKRLTVDADRYVEARAPAKQLADPAHLFGIGADR
ncbi:hypothetical protein [Burkholderia metallica]|uniref:hypothetical protein n=1 Tax=Burkholderia metallica TaxID=488729 RepID=UPI001CF4D7CA|nr:hypothetical protein [Burkholderia metallica]MCA8023466.1 hypothetical protein [Burkholderia metallica]